MRAAERLGLDLYGDEYHPVTLRVELSRLRALLGEDVLGSRPYALCRPVAADFRTVSEQLAQGRLADALRSYAGPLLPASEAPAIVETAEPATAKKRTRRDRASGVEL